jgi:hypothetical protein
VSRKAIADRAVTNKAESQSHHSRREICCGLNSTGRIRKWPAPSRGEGFGLLAETPTADFILRKIWSGSHYFRRAIQIEATSKTYRLARFKNLPIRAGAARTLRRRSRFLRATQFSRSFLDKGAARLPGASKDRTRVRTSRSSYSTVPFGRAAAGDFAAGRGACSSTRRA